MDVSSNVFSLAQQRYDQESEKKTGNVFEDAQKKYAEETKEPESFLASTFRTLYQIPSGIAQAMTYPLDILNALSTGEAYGGLDELEAAAEREGIPFDREKYLEGVQAINQYFPTQSNVERIIEEKTGAPLTAQTELQKAIRLGTSVGKLSPGTPLQRTAAGVVAPTVKAGLQTVGVPEPLAEIAGIGAAVPTAVFTPKELPKVKPVTKPSGMPARRFEKLAKPREVSASRMKKINQTLEKDFQNITNKIIEESPIGKTFENLRNDPTFKQQTRELLNEAQNISNELPGEVSTSKIKKEILDIASKKQKGYASSEYDKSYKKLHADMMEIKEDCRRAHNRIDKIGERIDATGLRIDNMYHIMMTFLTKKDEIK